MQGAPYALAHNEMFETKIENIAIFMCSRAGEWQLFEVEAETDWEMRWAKRLFQFYETDAKYCIRRN